MIRFRSPLLTEYPFLQVLRCFTSLRTPHQTVVPPHNGQWVPPFGNPRINALSTTPRGLSQPHTSFIGPVCQGIHHTPLPKHPQTQGASKQSQQTPDNTKNTRSNDQKKKYSTNKVCTRVHYPVVKPPTTHNQTKQSPKPSSSTM